MNIDKINRVVFKLVNIKRQGCLYIFVYVVQDTYYYYSGIFKSDQKNSMHSFYLVTLS